jgi:hypothetical protein
MDGSCSRQTHFLTREEELFMVTLVGIIGKSKATISEALSLNKLPQAIRDECRQDPAVPKNVLVEIVFPSFPPSPRRTGPCSSRP